MHSTESLIPIVQNNYTKKNPHTLQKWQSARYTADGAKRGKTHAQRIKGITVHTTGRCNQQCIDCVTGSHPYMHLFADMSEEVLENFLTEGHTVGLQCVDFGGGEPLLHPNLPRLVELSLANGYETLIWTNGATPSNMKKHFAALCALHSTYGAQLGIRVSIDATDETMHNAVRQDTRGFARALASAQQFLTAGFLVAFAYRLDIDEDEEFTRAAFQEKIFDTYFTDHDFDAWNKEQLACFPYLKTEETLLLEDVPEVTEECMRDAAKRDVINGMMCNDGDGHASRTVAQYKDAKEGVVFTCNLRVTNPEKAECATTLKGSRGSIYLNHPQCYGCYANSVQCHPTGTFEA